MQQNEIAVARLAGVAVKDVEPFDLSGSHTHSGVGGVGYLIDMPLIDFVSAMVELLGKDRGRCGLSAGANPGHR